MYFSFLLWASISAAIQPGLSSSNVLCFIAIVAIVSFKQINHCHCHSSSRFLTFDYFPPPLDCCTCTTKAEFVYVCSLLQTCRSVSVDSRWPEPCAASLSSATTSSSRRTRPGRYPCSPSAATRTSSSSRTWLSTNCRLRREMSPPTTTTSDCS